MSRTHRKAEFAPFIVKDSIFDAVFIDKQGDRRSLLDVVAGDHEAFMEGQSIDPSVVEEHKMTMGDQEAIVFAWPQQGEASPAFMLGALAAILENRRQLGAQDV